MAQYILMQEKITDEEVQKSMRTNFKTLLNSTLSEDMGIDFGSHNTLIYIKDKGIVLDEPSYIALDTRTNEIIEIGTKAYEMLGKNPKFTKILCPVENGVVSDIDLATRMLRTFISKVYKKTVLKPRIMLSVPSDLTDVERHSITEVLRLSGAREVFFINSPIAAAIGSGCDISLSRGMLIANIGGGRSDVSSISLGRSVVGKSIKTAGNTFTDAIIKYIKNTHNINIGYQTAENVKKTIGCAFPMEKLTSMNISGCDAANGFPRFVSVNSEEIRECLMSSISRISDLIKTVITDTPPELISDITDDGILITGGGAMIYGLDMYLKNELGLKVFVTRNMQSCVIDGIGAELSKLDLPEVQGGKFYYAVD